MTDSVINISNIDEKLLHILSDKKIHSGNDLSRILGVSRTTVNNIIKKLQFVGIYIGIVKGKGYILEHEVQRLNLSLLKLDNLVFFDSVSSTNSYSLSNNLPVGTFVLTEHQSKGRGRRDKKFLSVYGGQLLFSYIEYFNELSQIRGLSIAIGIAMYKALEQYGVSNVCLKWPNDLYMSDKKIGGILIETKSLIDHVYVVIGVGINVSNSIPSFLSKEVEQLISSIETEAKIKIEREKLVNIINKNFKIVINEFKENNLKNLYIDFNKVNLYKDKKIVLKDDYNKFEGVCRGITSSGELQIENSNGVVQNFIVGELSLRPA